MYGRVVHRRSIEARWPITVRQCPLVDLSGSYIQLVHLRLGDPRALFGCMFLDIFAVSGPIFLNLTLLPLVNSSLYQV